MTRSRLLIIPTLLALLAGCSSDSPTSVDSTRPQAVDTTATSTPSAPETTTTPPPTVPSSTDAPTTSTTTPATSEWLFDYLGAVPGEASGKPIRIGFVNQRSFSPESETAAQIAVDTLNTQASGAAGRPVELVPCNVENETDATACATSLATDPSVAMIMVGAFQAGNAAFYTAAGTAKPILVATGLTASDFLSTTSHTFTVGGAGVVAGLASFIVDGLSPAPQQVGVLHLDSPAGQASVDLFIRPILERAGVDAVFVPLPVDGDPAAVVAAISSGGAASADTMLLALNVANCVSAYDAFVQLGIAPTVVGVGPCNSVGVGEHLASLGLNDPVPNGWYFGNNGYSSYIPNSEAGVDAYNQIMDAAAATSDAPLERTGLAPITASTLFTIAKLMNGLGEAATDPTALENAIVTFEGPMMFQAGPIACGKTVIVGVALPAVCASQMGVHQYKDGTWNPVLDGNNGQAIDLNAI
jgi:hypothetical protein